MMVQTTPRFINRTLLSLALLLILSWNNCLTVVQAAENDNSIQPEDIRSRYDSTYPYTTTYPVAGLPHTLIHATLDDQTQRINERHLEDDETNADSDRKSSGHSSSSGGRGSRGNRTSSESHSGVPRGGGYLENKLVSVVATAVVLGWIYGIAIYV